MLLFRFDSVACSLHVDCSYDSPTGLHAIVPADSLVTVGATVYHVLAAIHTEWNQAATKPQAVRK